MTVRIAMARSTTYYTLIGSLPALPRHFAEAERVPISRLRLDERLNSQGAVRDDEQVSVTETLGTLTFWLIITVFIGFQKVPFL